MEPLKWYVKDESSERPGFLCLAIREEESHRLIADCADHPLEATGIVERTKAEAKLIAHAKELRDMLEQMVYAAETRREAKYREKPIYHQVVKESYALLDKLKND